MEKCAEEYHVYDTGQVERLKQEAIEGRRIDVQEANMKLAREAVTAAREAGKVGKWKDVIDNLNRVNSLLELSPEMIALKFLAEQELQKEKDNLLEQLESEKVTEFVEAINEDDKEKPCIRIKAMLDGEEVEATLVGTEKKTPLRGNKFEIGSILAGELKFGKGENNYIGFFKERIDWHGLKEVTVELKKFVFTGVVTLPKGVTLELIKVEAGSFVMGSPASEKGRRNDEKQHHVTLTQDYWLGKYEVTQAQYEALMGTNPSTKMVEVNCPVVEVSWNDAMEFCRLLTQREQWAERLPKGYEYTLPTEAQWEYAARGGHKASGYHIYSGGDNLKDLGWYNVNSEYTLKSVGLKCPNELGLYDMSGNALEWCYDWIDSYPSDSVTDPCVTVPSGGRVLRGGSNTTIEDSCRSSHRAYVMPAVPGESFGFRLALAPVKTTNKNEEAKYSNIIESSNNKDETISDISAKIVMLPNDVPLELVRVKAGSFMMGNAQHDNEQQPWEKPHQVTLTRDYWIGKYEVTQRQYEAIMNNNPSEICKGEHYPVENVTWENAMLFCRLLTQREREAGRLPDGYEYTLPTEAQWEFAARGGKKSKGYVYSGSNDYETVAWLHKNANATTHPVGQKQANELGLYDMSGNVEEWCRDWYEDDYAKDCEFLYDNQGKQHVMRGGHIHAFFPLYSRTSGRLERYPVDSGMNTGFRVALVYNPSTSLSLLSATSFGKSIKVTLPGGALLELVRIHAGGFMMGSPENESGRERDEKTHSVKLTKDYWIGKYEVTQGQWKAVMGISLDEKAQQINSISGENRAGKVGDEYPMFLVNWEDALEFCRKLTEYERISGLLPDGYEYTLPTEAQWEFAARGGRRSKHCKYSGSNDSNTVAWTSENSEWRLHPVGTKSPNELGIYDMSGNVYEMCLDQCAGNYNTKILKEMNMLDLIDDNGISRNLVITDTYRDGILDPYCRNAHEHIRVTRGGSFNYSDNKARVADRNQCECHGYYSDLGFRVVLSALPSETEKQGNTEQSSEPKTQQMPETIIDEPTKKESTVNTRTIILPNNVALELVKVKAGSFMMGSPESETGQGVDEIQHRVELTKDFWIGKYEVTQAQYEAVMGNNPAYFKKGSNYPVERVSWFDAMFFCKKLTEREQSIGEVPNGYEFTLPTEAQWEYAARGGHKSSGYHVYAGSDSIVFVTWYEKNSGRTTHPVGQKHANELKVYDMSGNVFEWCRDWYSSEKHSSTVDPVGSSSGLRRVRRGGSWNSMSWNCRLVFRSDSSPSSRENFNGFRVVLAPVQ
ncbi:MAG: SUMF1/EgtB/PvdO family nonheme iron enzyme [Victivallales bacterium]|nr:SUMF1/EgtB/PvdO family nonheme iron enzyme [Victivallales bacterium]